jgi:peptidoglycan/xylan/chitin deacetylase (PgdA/CDA1 family)
MLDWLSDKYSIISAQEYLFKLLHGILDTTDICLTFDDGLLCQAEIAAPILRANNLHAFFFIYSSPFKGNPEYLEVYRYFRMTAFLSVDDFYEEFFAAAELLLGLKYKQASTNYDSDDYLKNFPFYTSNDKWFRYLRNIVLSEDGYRDLMRIIMKKHNFDPTGILDTLWMSDADLKMLRANGHIIGLHSYSHPTMLHTLSIENQAEEYEKNFQHLAETLNEAPIAMSHPCGSYNQDTLKILTDKGVKIGFRSNLSVPYIKSHLEVPREDHANILEAMSK